MSRGTRPSEPRVERPHVPEYGIPETLDGALPWTWARERLESALEYWVATTRPDGRPHLMPLWVAWVDEAAWFEGGLQTRRARNLELNAGCAIGIDDGIESVIVEGIAARVTELDPGQIERLVAGYEKYVAARDYRVDPANWRIGGLWRVRPTVAFGWIRYPDDATRWRFG
jgi:hypothetical protein